MDDNGPKYSMTDLKIQSELCILLGDIQRLVSREIKREDVVNLEEMIEISDFVGRCMSRVVTLVNQRKEIPHDMD